MADNTRFSVARGETFILPMQLTLSDGSYYDLTGITFTGSLQETYSSQTKYPLSFVVQDEASGSLEMSLDTTSMKSGEYVYTTFIISGSVWNVLLDGQFQIRPSTK